MTDRIVIVQDYVPRYRSAFFRELAGRLRVRGLELVVLSGVPRGDQRIRNDAAGDERWKLSTTARQIRLPIGGPTLKWFDLHGAVRKGDGLILGLTGTSLNNYFRLVRHGGPVGLWGHVKDYVGPGSSLDQALEGWQIRRASHVFAYTQVGARSAIDRGARPDRVTAVFNSVDVRGLQQGLGELTSVEIADFMSRHSLVDGHVFGYIGALDEPKRVDVLIRELDQLWSRNREVRLLVGGTGALKGSLDPAIRRGQAVMLGPVGDREKAMIIRVSQALVNPGRIGLLAVEALASGIPIVTTDLAVHAPEYEYLVEGASVRICDGRTSGALAEFLISMCGSATPARQSWPYPGLDGMVDNFESGILQMIS